MNGSITLSSSEFKALASDTRAGIIKLLQERNHTLSELSKKLGLAAPTVKQHLAVLQETGIIKGMDEGRKWKYYTLTKKGRKIFSPEQPASILIVLGATVLAMLGMVYWFFLSLAPFAAGDMRGVKPVLAPGREAAGGALESIGDGAAGNAVKQAAEYASMLPPETLALLAGIVAASLLAGFLIGKLKRQHAGFA